MEIKRKDGIVYNRSKARGKETIPSRTQYNKLIKDLTTKNLWAALIVVRMGCELGLARIDIVNAEVKNIDRYHPRGLWVEISKRVKRKGKMEMRSREIPIPPSLYGFIQNYIDTDQKYILKRKRGNIMIPFEVQKINDLYTMGSVSFSSHKARHYYRTQLKKWMRENRQFDSEVIDALMGHRPREAREMYGVIDWEYKQEIIDKVFE